MDNTVRYQESRRITLLGALKNISLSIIKIIFGIYGHSHALIADGFHSVSDLLIDALVLVASRFGSKVADRDHPYGHGRIETATTVLLALILSLVGVAIIYDAGKEIFEARVTTIPAFYVLLVALLSVLVNEALYRYTRAVGEKIKSNLLITNAWHHRSDSASSLVVLIGAGAAWFGFPKLDAVAAVIVGVMIIKMAVQFGWISIRELVDTGLDEAIVDQIKKSIIAVPGVCAIHQLRTRSVGGAIFLDVHILVDPTISVSEGHFICQQVHFRLMKEVAGVVDVTVHVDPEDDELVAPSRHLPAREKIVASLQERWKELLPREIIEKATLHYLGGKIFVELRLPLAEIQRNENIGNHLQEKIADVAVVAGLKVLFEK